MLESEATGRVMGGQPQGGAPAARKPIFHSLSVCAGCGCDGDDFGSVNVEAFEITGELYCEECADEAIQENSQFGVGA